MTIVPKLYGFRLRPHEIGVGEERFESKSICQQTTSTILGAKKTITIFLWSWKNVLLPMNYYQLLYKVTMIKVRMNLVLTR